ncbi:MAG: hypothetical protein IPF93_15415 [Saprospiraceae bacterium]|nr:hypothetical protein [Saprospiraceae bacterium]
MDERRIGSKQYIGQVHINSGSKTKRMHSNSKLVWNNIQHIVQLLDQHDVFAWDSIAIGSDNDGIIDPINLFWTSEEMDDLVQYIERHAHNFYRTLLRRSKMITIGSRRQRQYKGYFIAIRWSF